MSTVYTFKAWMELVDHHCWILFSCSIDDLPDCNFHIEYTNGTTPAAMARKAYKNAGGY